MKSATWSVSCPKCGAGLDQPCRALTSNRVTDTHVARWEHWWNLRGKDRQ